MTRINSTNVAGPDEPSRLTDRIPRTAQRHWGTVLSLCLAALIVVLAILAPALSPTSPTEMDPSARFVGPSQEHLFGTDQFGRDILTRVLFGARISLSVGIASVTLAALSGTGLGLAAGYFGGPIRSVIMRFTDVLMAFPAILLAVTLMAVLGSSLSNVVLAIGIVYTPIFTRLVNGLALGISQSEYVAAARATGANDLRVLLRHVLPNLRSTVVIQMSLSLSTAILAEAALSFLGLGTQPPTPSWGRMLAESTTFMEIAPWSAIFPGVAIMITVVAFNLLGDRLRDAWDPRDR